jgi:hypothetical protein
METTEKDNYFLYKYEKNYDITIEELQEDILESEQYKNQPVSFCSPVFILYVWCVSLHLFKEML